MDAPHDAGHIRQELDQIEQALCAQTTRSAGEYIDQRRTLSTGPDRAALLRFDRENEVADRARAHLHTQRETLIAQLGELEGNVGECPTAPASKPSDSRLTPQRASAVKPVTPPIASAPAPVKPVVLPEIRAIYAAAMKVPLPPVNPVPPVAPAPVLTDGERLMRQAAEKSNQRRRAE